MFQARMTGACPHCGMGVRFEELHRTPEKGSISGIAVKTRKGYGLRLTFSGCTLCHRPILVLATETTPGENIGMRNLLLWPAATERPVPVEVEEEAPEIAGDFLEASVVLPFSEKASAALSRRCLQSVLISKGSVKKNTSLDRQIEEVLEHLPSELAKNVDAIRTVGNFAAHPIKSTDTGKIVEVEEEEAEWLLEVLEELFDYYYVRPRRAAARRAKLEEKLEEAGKPLLKQPSGKGQS